MTGKQVAAMLSVGLCLCAGVAHASPRIVLHSTRAGAGDLEIGGSLAGVPRGQTRFVRYAELLTLPLETYTVTGDTNFGKTVRITGIPLEKLPRWLGAAPGAGMVIAVCDDAYAAHYPTDYLRAHHPLLVLRVNGKDPAHWPVGVDGVPMGPYMVSHAHYTPGFRVLSHEDEAQVPWGVVRLDFRNEAEVYAPIEPRMRTPLVDQGYIIARQSCFRCHSRDGEGGLKSSRSWGVVARRAQNDPQWFDAYVRNPKKINAASQMAASPQYDESTLRALRAYFMQFSEDAP
jgi:mono/diheme cytochrome c family protein